MEPLQRTNERASVTLTRLVVRGHLVSDSIYRTNAHNGHVLDKSDHSEQGYRAFCVAGPVAWNSLPLDIRSATTS